MAKTIVLGIAKVTQGRALKIAILIFLTFLPFPKSFANSDSDTKQITELEHQRAAAVVDRDTAFLDKMTAADSVRILPTGAIETKSQLLTELSSGAVTYTSIDVDQLSVKVYGDAAVATGRSVFRGQNHGKPFDGRCRFSRVWRKTPNGWQEVLFQLTAIREEP